MFCVTTRDNVIDWPLDFATRCGFDPDKLVGRVVNHLAGTAKTLSEKYNVVVRYEATAQQEKEAGQNRHVYDALKKESPLFAQCEAMIQKRKHLSGYWAEKVDREIASLAQQIITNKTLSKQIKENFPAVNHRLRQYLAGLQAKKGREL